MDARTPLVIEILESSSSIDSPRSVHGRQDLDEGMEPPKETAASRVSVASLLGSSHDSPPRLSPKNRPSETQPVQFSPPPALRRPSLVEPRADSGPSQPATNGNGNQTHPSNGATASTAKAATAPSEARNQDDADSSDGSASDTAEPSKSKDAPKSKKRQKRRSPSPPEPIAPSGPPSRPTIRLSLTDAKKDGYLINVPDLVYVELKAKKHPWAQWYESNMDIIETPAPSAPGLEEVGGGLARLLAKYPSEAPGAGARKRKPGGKPDEGDAYDIGAYDTKDPFVDDSELGVDEPTHFAKPKSDGFYVTQGPVELAKIKAGKGRSSGVGSAKEKAKPLSIRDSKSGFAGSINKLIAKKAMATLPAAPPATAPAPGPSTNGGGSIHLTSLLKSGSPSADRERSASVVPMGGTPSRKVEGTRDSPIKVDDADDSSSKASKKARYPTRPVDPRLQAAFDNLKAMVSQESFAVKTKFPPNLKPPLIETAKLAVELGEYNDNFFNYLPTIFPYNRFTMMKLTKREFFQHHVKYFKDLQDEHMDILGRMIKESFPAQKAEYEAAHKAWEDRGGPEQEGESQAPPTNGEAPMEVDSSKPSDEDLIEPQKRWKWTEAMREEVYTLINIENAMSEVKNEKLKLENSTEQFSEINARKACYKQMSELFPEDGWTTSTNISREYAQLKKKKDRQEARQEAADHDDSRASSIIPA